MNFFNAKCHFLSNETFKGSTLCVKINSQIKGNNNKLESVSFELLASILQT